MLFRPVADNAHALRCAAVLLRWVDRGDARVTCRSLLLAVLQIIIRGVSNPAVFRSNPAPQRLSLCRRKGLLAHVQNIKPGSLIVDRHPKTKSAYIIFIEFFSRRTGHDAE